MSTTKITGKAAIQGEATRLQTNLKSSLLSVENDRGRSIQFLICTVVLVLCAVVLRCSTSTVLSLLDSFVSLPGLLRLQFAVGPCSRD